MIDAILGSDYMRYGDVNALIHHASNTKSNIEDGTGKSLGVCTPYNSIYHLDNTDLHPTSDRCIYMLIWKIG
jgi:hypothetical protein